MLEISQTCAVQTGCFSGDSAGFPVTIDGTAGDSYQLTSDLIVPDENTSGISFAQPASSNSSIDLKGFSIIRAACVGTNPGCTPATGSGSGIEITNAVIRGISVQNGNIIGMGAYGVSLGDHASVKGLRVRWNRLAGISVTIDSLVTDCTATQNNGGGIVATTSATITNNSVYQNAINGISVSFGSVVSHNVASQSFIDGINAGFGATVYGNSSYDNGGDGIDVNQGSLVHGNTAHSNDGFGLRVATLGGYRENVMSGNTAGSVSGAGLNLGANACNGVICP